MKKILSMILFFLLPLAPVVVYSLSASGSVLYRVSVALGTLVFALIGTQFILAAKPPLIVGAFGVRTVNGLHRVLPIAIIALAFSHEFLKIANGFTEDTLQRRMGALSLAIAIGASLVALLLMVDSVLLKAGFFARFRKWARGTKALGYKASRVIHSCALFLAATIMVHVTLASTSSFARNPAGYSMLALWMFASLMTFIVYRLKGRQWKGAKA